MKNIFKSALLLGVVTSMALTGCIDEVQPTSSVTQEMLNSSVKAGQATIFAIPARMVAYTGFADWHGSFGYPSMMHIRDLQLDEMICYSGGTNYNQWSGYERARYANNYWYPQWIWNYYNSVILCCNNVCKAFPADTEDEAAMGARSIGLAYRAMLYLDTARWFEFLPNDKTSNINEDGNDVLHLTVPIVTENTTEEEARENPRVSREVMFEFIKGDLEYALANIDKASPELKVKTLPNKACVLGLLARLYMWVEDYPTAADYAQQAIVESGCTPLTEAQWSDLNSGFNDMYANHSWMWGIGLETENDAVKTGICNFTSFMSFEAVYGYAAVKAFPACGKSFFDRISTNDFRKLSWVPTSRLQALKINVLGDNSADRKYKLTTSFPLAPIKFRPGQGNTSDYTVGSATDVPLMRVEEMYFTLFEAIAHTNPKDGMDQMTKWLIDTGRNPKYSSKLTDKDAIIEEIVFQKRVELWGEGLNMYDFKRLGYAVDRTYKGTNYYSTAQFKTEGRPAWLNMVFVRTEGNNNKALVGWNNPDVDGLYSNDSGGI